MEGITLQERVTMTKVESIDPDYGYLVEVDGEDKGTIVGIDRECRLMFKACMPLGYFELQAIGAKLEEKEGELFREGLLG
ncbi:MAG: hypothetical protein ACJA0H_000316 [Francisellaceae bacterium]|jgi:hypothetical protein